MIKLEIKHISQKIVNPSELDMEVLSCGPVPKELR